LRLLLWTNSILIDLHGTVTHIPFGKLFFISLAVSHSQFHFLSFYYFLASMKREWADWRGVSSLRMILRHAWLPWLAAVHIIFSIKHSFFKYVCHEYSILSIFFIGNFDFLWHNSFFLHFYFFFSIYDSIYNLTNNIRYLSLSQYYLCASIKKVMLFFYYIM